MLGIAWLLGFHLLRAITWVPGDSAAIKAALLSAASGHGLFPLVILFGAVAWWLRRLNRNDDGRMYGFVAAITTAASLALLMWFGFVRDGDPHNITWTLAIYALAALIAGVKLDRRCRLCRFDAGLHNLGESNRLSLQSYVANSAAVGRCIVVARDADCDWRCPIVAAPRMNTSQSPLQLDGLKDADRKLNVLRPLRWSAGFTALVAAVWMVVLIRSTSTPSLAVALAWLAGVWMLLSVLEVSPVQFNLSQAALVLAILCSVTTVVRISDWYTAAAHPWARSRFLELQGVAPASYCILFAALRWKLVSLTKQRNESVPVAPTHAWLNAAATVANPPWPMVDRIVEVMLVALVVLVATYGEYPGAAQELSPTEGVGRRRCPGN